jgi:hypothetical protein
MASGEMSREEFTRFLEHAFTLMGQHSADGSIHFICMDWRHMREMLDAGEGVYAELKNLIVWAKDNGGMGSFYRSRHQLIFAFKKGDGPHINSFELGQHAGSPCMSRRSPGDVRVIEAAHSEASHGEFTDFSSTSA